MASCLRCHWPIIEMRVNPSDLKHLMLPEHVSETGEIVLEAMKLQVPLEEKLEDLRFTVDDLRERLRRRRRAR